MGPQIMNNIERGQAIARLLFESFRNKGIHWRNEMPEDEPPPGVQGGSLDHVLFTRRLLRSITSGMVTRCGKALERRLPTPRPDTCLIRPRCMRTEEGSRGLVEIRRFQKTEEGLGYLSDRRDHLPQEME